MTGLPALVKWPSLSLPFDGLANDVSKITKPNNLLGRPLTKGHFGPMNGGFSR
jgi:hypothetical protein